jgi:xanthine dehydrogenase accessory factor
MPDSGDPSEIFDWPWFGLKEDVRPAARAGLAAGAPITLATLVETRGSSPRPLGSRMLIDSQGAPEGYVSGGCVEASVAGFAAAVLETGTPHLVTLGAGSPYVDIRLPCGGSIDLYIERVTPDDPIVTPWLGALAARTPGVWLADVKTNARAFIGPGDGPPSDLQDAFTLAENNPVPAARVGDAFFRRDEPALRLIVVGGDPVALALLKLAEAMDWEAHLVRDAGPAEGPPGVSYAPEDPAIALPKLGVDPWTAVITTTHDLERDAAAIVAALGARALYVGALGSKRRIPERTETLKSMGLADDEIARIRSPIGIDIGATSPYEIALATMADVIAVRRA